uniref:NADH-ubiquinone oxidoreductase chain 5 n=1 Tax=Nepiomorpha sp. NespEL TaxID=1940904 RepID=A0A8K1ZG33_9NEOP|nr:NADH dehydrogenase subunit 5 [Nepiomorpha sp. NespEL]
MKKNSSLVICLILMVGSVVNFLGCLLMLLYNKSYFIDFEVFLLNGVSISMSVLLDWMSCSFMGFVLLISFVVVNYSISYMSSDKNLSMFILLVFFFVLSMMLLIISPNLVSILLGWDGLGLISYCLVIYYQNIKSYNAGMLTAMTNRIGDVFILLSIGWMLNFGSWNFMFLSGLDSSINDLIIMMIMIAAITKSAQIPFSSWLPAAMAAPTPVSALVHSSTLVTAGVYLLIRFSGFLPVKFSWVLLVCSVLTMFMSGLGAIFENDLKKIIALSTLSQLGLMISTLILGMVDFTFFHLLTHALFKSLLFMCAGYVIHGYNDCQDIRFLGGIIKQSPWLGIYFNVSNLSLCGMPFLAGFYSKDLILENIMMMNSGMLIFGLFIVSTMCTVIYTFRLIYFSMIDSFSCFPYNSYNDEDYVMLMSMFMIFIFVIIGGSTLSWLMFIDFELIVLPVFMKTMVLVLCILSAFIGYYFGESCTVRRAGTISIYLKTILGEMWFLPYLSTYSINFLVLKVGYMYIKMIDLGWAEILGGQGVYNLNVYLSKNLNLLSSKNVIYLIFIMFMILIFLVYL